MKITHRAAYTNRRQIFHSACLVAACLSVTSCLESHNKPIPPLNPSLSTADTATPVVDAPITPGTITRMPLGTLYQLTQGNAALIYDVRPLIIYKVSHIPGAISFPKADFDKDIAKHEVKIKTAIKNQTPVVLYCTDFACPDALAVASQLSQRGHNVSVLQGGYEAWKAATQ